MCVWGGGGGEEEEGGGGRQNNDVITTTRQNGLSAYHALLCVHGVSAVLQHPSCL